VGYSSSQRYASNEATRARAGRFVLQASSAIAEVIDRLKANKATPSAAELKFVRDGKAEIQIWLTDKTQTISRS
jgi:hypothetical protein